jgi:uncharacterized protein YjdB
MPDDMPAVISIGEYAFNRCAELTEVTFTINIKTIGTGAFAGCINMNDFSIGGGLKNNYFMIDGSGILMGLYTSGNNIGEAERVIKAPIRLSDDYSGIPGTVRVIDPEAFAYSNLETITIPGSVNNIGRDAFSWGVLLREAIFEGDAPQTLPSGTRGLFENVASGFVIYYYPYTLRWPTSQSANWRGYPAVAMTSYVTLDRSAVALEIGATVQLKATVYPQSANQQVRWNVIRQSEPANEADEPEPGSIDHIVATVSSEGVVHAIGLGWADVTATSTRPDGITITSPPCRIYVVERNVAVTGVALNKTQMTLTAGGDADTLSAVVYPLDATNKELIWSSSNTSVAYVDVVPYNDHDTNDPEVDANTDGVPSSFHRLVVPVAPGSATITVTTADGARKAVCNVTVTAAPAFVPVSNIALSTTTIATGSVINLTDMADVQPANATNQNISWRIIEQTTQGVTISFSGDLIFPGDKP